MPTLSTVVVDESVGDDNEFDLIVPTENNAENSNDQEIGQSLTTSPISTSAETDNDGLTRGAELLVSIKPSVSLEPPHTPAVPTLAGPAVDEAVFLATERIVAKANIEKKGEFSFVSASVVFILCLIISHESFMRQRIMTGSLRRGRLLRYRGIRVDVG
jgi:hypothetical protein